MQEYPIPYYVVEFLSEEWIIWSTFSLIFILTPLVFAKYLNSSQKKYLLYIMGVLLIIESVSYTHLTLPTNREV